LLSSIWTKPVRILFADCRRIDRGAAQSEFFQKKIIAGSDDEPILDHAARLRPNRLHSGHAKARLFRTLASASKPGARAQSGSIEKNSKTGTKVRLQCHSEFCATISLMK
jgi:hypothetical protein